MEDTKLKDCKKVYVENIATGDIELLANRKKTDWAWRIQYNLLAFITKNSNARVEDIKIKFK